MWGFQRGSGLLSTLLRAQRVPRAPVTSKPPEHPLSAAEQVIGFSAMFVSCLAPAAWILAHIDNYKSKSE